MRLRGGRGGYGGGVLRRDEVDHVGHFVEFFRADVGAVGEAEVNLGKGEAGLVIFEGRGWGGDAGIALDAFLPWNKIFKVQRRGTSSTYNRVKY